MNTGGFEHIEEIPESTKTILVVTVLEDLSDSQLVLSINERAVESRHYLALVAILSSATSMLSGRYAGETLRAQVEMSEMVADLYDRLGVENPFKPGESLEDQDVRKPLDEISQYLDEDTED